MGNRSDSKAMNQGHIVASASNRIHPVRFLLACKGSIQALEPQAHGEV